MKKEQTAHAVRRWIQRPGAQVWTAFWSTLVFGLFCHGMGLLNKLSHQDDIANLFGFGATITSGRWMLHVLSWLEGLFFGTGNASLPLYNGAISILCVGASCALLVDLLRIRNRVYCALMGSLMVAFPVMAVLFSYMFTSHPYMLGLLMMTLCGWLICKETPWWLKVVGVVLGSASVGVYQAFLPMLPTIFLIDDLMKLKRGKEIGKILRSIGVQALCAAGVLLVYFAVNRLFLHKFGLELSSYQGIDQMESMSVRTLLERTGKAYRLFFFPGENPGADMYPGTLRGMYYLMLAVNGLLAGRRVLRASRESLRKAVLLAALYLLIPLGCNLIYVMSEEVHGLMVYGQVMQAVLLIAQLDEFEEPFARGKQAVSLAASLMLAVTCVMYARFDNQCYLKDTLQQQAAMSYYTTLITRMKSQKGYRPDLRVAFVGDWTELDPTIYDLEEMDFIRLNLYGHSTTEYIHYYKEVFMRRWCGFEADWYWEGNPEAWPEVQAMPEYPADGSIQIVNDVLVVKF